MTNPGARPDFAVEPGGATAQPAAELSFGAFLRRYRRWWLWPLAACVLAAIATVAAFLTSTMPFIYSIF